MKKPIAVLLGVLLLFTMSACAAVQLPEKEETVSGSVAGGTETEPGSVTEPQEPSREEETMKQAQFYIIAGGTVLAADFADNDSGEAFRELLRGGDLTICMSDYGGFEKVGSIGKSLPRKDTEISATAGDVMLYEGNRIVLFYGTNRWEYSRLGRIGGVTTEALRSALGSGDVSVTFSLTNPR